MIAQSSAPSRPSTAPPPPIASWVYGLVYTGFSLLGIGLLGAFAFYARQRWASSAAPSATPHQRSWLRAAAALLAASAAAHLALAGTPLTARVVDAGLSLAGAAALLVQTRGRLPRRQLLAAVALAFAATGAAAAWGTYQLVVSQVNDFVTAADTTTVETVTQLARAAVGILGGTALAIRLRR